MSNRHAVATGKDGHINPAAADLIKSKDKKLYKKAIAIKIDGNVCDLSTQVTQDQVFDVITRDDSEALDIIRHSTAHLLAHAVKQLYPSAQVTIGPVIENGFYYDFFYPEGFNDDDLKKIDKQMRRLIKQGIKLRRKTLSRHEAIVFFREMGEEYKAKIIEDIPENQTLSLYEQSDFVDLCRGPHVPSTAHLGSFKLTKLAGAYWRGDSNNVMLQRIYGTAWLSDTQLTDYLEKLKEMEKRDHRKLAKTMNLWHIQPEAPGMIFWHANGWFVYQQMLMLMRRVYHLTGFNEVHTPQIVSSKLWEKSGHWDKFSEDMFTLESEKDVFAIKPMNCPCHIQIYNQHLHSYKELPIRIGEFGCCHRNEDSGALSGLMRLRQFVQDDGHILCSPEQIAQEVNNFIDIAYKIYASFGFSDIILALSTRPEKYVGSIESWDHAEKVLEDILNGTGRQWTLQENEGAFYGPKIEFSLRDCMGRIWQCGTVQLDFSMPERLGAIYIDSDGQRQTPVMIHRAILGSVERFMGILLENTYGHLPLWLMPKQVVIIPVNDTLLDYCESIKRKLAEVGLRVEIDYRNEKVGYKIRQSSIEKTPYMLVIGEKELEKKSITYRCKGVVETTTLAEFTAMLVEKSTIPDIK